MNSENTCCFFGHRKINETPSLTDNLKDIIENLIVDKNITTFLFGSKSDFDSLCLKVVTNLKGKYPNIDINNSYKDYLLESYEETYYPEKVKGSGKASYIMRNQEMINKSAFCIVYYDENYAPQSKGRSGTKIAYEYAIKKKCEIINMFTL